MRFFSFGYFDIFGLITYFSRGRIYVAEAIKEMICLRGRRVAYDGKMDEEASPKKGLHSFIYMPRAMRKILCEAYEGITTISATCGAYADLRARNVATIDD